MANTYRFKTEMPGFYAMPISGTEEKGYSAIYRNPYYEDTVGASDFIDITSSFGLFQNGLNMNPNAPCIAKREVLKDGSLGDFKSKTYKEVDQLSRIIGSAISQLGITESDSGLPGVRLTRLFGLYVPNCEEWVICELGCYAYEFGLVPIYNTLTESCVNHILVNSGITVLVVNKTTAKSLMRALEFGVENIKLKKLIFIGTNSVPSEMKDNAFGLECMTWDDLIQMGKSKPLPIRPARLDTINVISYTSGTTGLPKGVVITHKNLLDTVVVTLEHSCKKSNFPENFLSHHVSYLPMAHLFEKTFINAVFYSGGQVGLYSGDVKKVLEDIQIFRPTFFVSVPRLYQRIHDKVMCGVSEKSTILQSIFNFALETKVNRIKNYGLYNHWVWDSFIFSKIQKLLGGRVKWMFIGSCGMNPIILDHIKAFFGVPVIWGYALTECTAGGTIQNLHDSDSSHCGGPIPAMQYRIRSVPDLNYDANGTPPRGELLLRGGNITPGYFKDELQTKETINDGWLHTGDIVELLENGGIKIIDRIKQLFKLSQGEYISPAYIEAIINSSPLVAQSFVVGRPDEAFPVAILVPDKDRIHGWMKTVGLVNMTYENVCKSDLLYNTIMKQITELFDSSKVRGYERVKVIHVEHEQFSVENQLLTVTSKLKRNALSAKYKDEIDAMYQKLKAITPRM